MYRILILSSAALAFSGCAFNDGGSYFGHGSQAYSQSGAYGYNNCGASQCASGNSYTVADNYHHQDSHDYGYNHNSYAPVQNYNEVESYAPEQIYNPAQGYAYGAPQQPSTHAYGSHVQAYPAYAGQGYGHLPHLRGAYGLRGQRGYKYGTLGVVNYDTDADLYGLQGRIGVQTSKFLGAEAEGSIGLISDKQTLGTAELKTNVDYSLAAFARGVLPVSPRLNLFGRAGYHVTEIGGDLTDALGTTSASLTTDGFAYGAGAEFAVNPRDAIRLDYTRYDLGPGDTDSLAVSYARKF